MKTEPDAHDGAPTEPVSDSASQAQPAAAAAVEIVVPVKKTLAEKIIEQTLAKPASDFEARPMRASLVEFKREDLIKVLRPQSATVKRAAQLLAGVMRAHPGKTVIVIRE